MEQDDVRHGACSCNGYCKVQLEKNVSFLEIHNKIAVVVLLLNY